MADTTDLSDLGTKDPQPRSLANAYDLSDLGQKVQGSSWKDQPVDVKAVDLSDLGSKDAEPKSYTVQNGQVHFDVARPATGLAQAVTDGVIDKDYAEEHKDDFLRAQVKYQDFEQAAGGGQVAKALLHGAGRGGAFLAGAIPGGKVGAGAGALIPGAEEFTVPIGATIGSLTTGTIAAVAYNKAIDKLSDYNDFVKSFAASAELHPKYDATGELLAFAASAPKSISKLVELGRVDLADEGASATRALLKSPAVAAQVTKGAVGGAAFEGVLRPGFDVTRNLIADQLGIPHDQTQAPSLSSLAQNIGLGILTAGHSVEFRDFAAGDIVNIEMRAKAREAAGIPLNDDNPQGVIQGFQTLGANPEADLEQNGLLRPLTPEEISVHASIQTKMRELQESGQLTDKEVEALGARQASIPGFRSRIPISRASVTLRERATTGEPNALNTVPNETGVPTERVGTDEVGQTGTEAGVGDSVPSTTGEPPKAPVITPAPVPAPVSATKVANPKWGVTVMPGVKLPNGQVTPGGVQIDSFVNGTNEWSKNPKQLADEGYQLPDLSKLPAGRYTLEEATHLLNNPQAAPKPTKQVGAKVSAGGDIEPVQPGAPTPPAPEPSETIRAQMDMLTSGKRHAVLITPGEIRPRLPKGFKSVVTSAGTFIYNPEVLNPAQINKAVDENKIGDILNYGIEAKPAPGTEVGAVVVRDPKGVEKQGVLTDAEHLDQVTDKAKEVASPGDTIAVEPEADVIKKRQERGSSVPSKEGATLRALRKELKTLQQGLPVAEDMAMNDKGASLARLEAKIAAIQKQIADLTPSASVPAPTKKEWKEVGVNSKGHKVYEDASGVRSYVEKGVRVTEPVALVPTRTANGGIQMVTRPSDNRSDDFKTVDETGQAPTLPASANEPTEVSGGSVSPAGGGPATVGEAGGGRPAGDVAQGPSGQVQPGIRPEDAGATGKRGADRSRIADADANGVPAEPKPEAPIIPAADTGVETSDQVRGKPSASNPAPDPEIADSPTATNIRLAENPAPTGSVARVKANIAAITLVKKLEEEKRFPTDEERKILAQWSGWGSFNEMFNEGRAERRDFDAGWVKRYGAFFDQLKKLLTPEEFNAAAESASTAHYTSKEVVDGMWNLVKRLGFEGGKALEPATGSGVFVGYVPDDLARQTRWTGVEMEPLTGRIFKYLYPEVDTRIMPFENTKLANGYYDLVITNVPFHEEGPGKEYPDMNLHNYFIARSLDKTKPGGLVVIITSNATMDNDGRGRAEQRATLAEKGQLVGAIRLPNDAFKSVAGTEVVTDIIVLRKPDGKPFEGAQPWKGTQEIEIGDDTTRVNQYFVDHPEMVLGKHALTGTMYRKDSYTVESTPGPLADKLAAAIARFPENITKPAEVSSEEPAQTQLEEGTLQLDKAGHVLEARNFQLQPPISWDPSSSSLVKRAKLYIVLRDILKGQYNMEDDPNASDAELEANRARLNRAYQALLRELGAPLNRSERKLGYLSTDPDYYTVLGLEVTREAADPKNPEGTVTVIEPAAVLSKRVKLPDVPPDKVASAVEALGVSLAYRGGFDLEYVKQLTGMTEQAIEVELVANDLAYKDPETGRIITSLDYLTGDVREKLAKAIFAAKESDEFARNVESLRKVIPETYPFGKIRLGLNARWVPATVFNLYAKEIIGFTGDEITFVPGIEEFAVSPKRQLSAKTQANWTTKARNAYELLGDAMNFRRAKIMVEVGEGKYAEDTGASALANTVIDNMALAFQEWVRNTKAGMPYRYFDADRGDYVTEQMPVWQVLEKEFNRTKNSFVPPKNDGTMLRLPGLSTLVTRKQHLLDGVMRAIVQGSSVYGHGVGSGKTFLSIVVMHELQRIGLMKKGVVVIKKPTVDQFRASIERAYPGSKVLMPTEKDFKPANRKKLTARIASGRFDFIVLTHEQFKAIRTSEESVNAFFEDQIEQLREILRNMGQASAEDAKSTRGLDPAVRNIVKKLKSLKKRLATFMDSVSKKQDVGVQWEKLGVDGVWIDESHNFKKMPLPTQMEAEVKGVPSDFSQRAVDLLIKLRDVQRRTNGRNVFFASGTPVSNTLAELWLMFYATNPKLIKDFGIQTFDSFATTYADVVNSFELGWDNKFKDVTRMSRFKNPGSLTLLTRMGMDVRMGNKELGLDVPEMEGGKPIIRVIKAHVGFERWLSFLNDIVRGWESLDPKGRFENSWVPITTMRAGSAAALDPRCVFEGAVDHPDSKVNTAVRDIIAEWNKGREKRTTMMVFADMYRTLNASKLRGFTGGESAKPVVDIEAEVTPVEEAEDSTDTGAKDANAYEANAVGQFNLYQDIKAKLIKAGIPENEIAIITDFDTDVKRNTLFNKVRSGGVRILLGSTEKIGEGVDVPQRMSAQFHLDPPMQMTPAKMEQRLGRIIRQGNLHSPKNWNLPVRVYMYAQERSMDATIYQMLETKSVAIVQAMKGQFLGDEFDDPAGEFTTAMAEMKAAATGDNRVLELAKLQKEVRELGLEESSFHRKVSELRSSISEAERVSKYQKEEAERYTVLANAVAKEMADKDAIVLTHKDKRYVGEKAIDEFLERMRPKVEDAIKEKNTKVTLNVKLGTGVNVTIEGRTTEGFNGQLSSSYQATFYIGLDLNWGVPRWDSTLNSIEGLLNAAKNIPKFAQERAIKAVTFAKSQDEVAVEYAETFKNTKFTKADVLSEKRGRLRELEGQLREEGRKKPMDPKAPANTTPPTSLVPVTEVELADDEDPSPPIEDRLKAQIKELLPTLQKLDQDITRGETRVQLLPAGSDEQAEAAKNLQETKDSYAVVDNRMTDLERRLAVVMKFKYPDAPTEINPGPDRPELSVTPTPTSMGEETVVRGLQELARLLRDPRSGLSSEARRVAMELLNMPVMQNLDWSNLVVSLKNRLEGGYSGSADVSKNLIEMAKATTSTTFPHEVFHFLFHMLSPEDKAHVEAARIEALQKELDDFKASGGDGQLPPDALLLFGQLLSGKLSSEAFVQQLNRLKVENPVAAEWWATMYDMINPGEFLAGMAGRRFAKESFESRNYSWWDDFMAKLKGWVRGIIDALRKLFGARPTMDQMYRDILNGKRVTRPETGVRYESGFEGQLEEGEPLENAGIDPADLEFEVTKAEETAAKEKWIKTEVLGRKDYVHGRDVLSNAERAAGADYAKKVFDRAGLQVTQQPNNLWTLTDPGFDAEIEGRKLLDLITKEIAIQSQPGSVTGYLGNLLNSVVVNMTQDNVTAFSPELKRDLYSVAQGERSQRGLLLAALAGFGKTVEYIGRNVDTVLSRVYADRFGGDEIRRVLARVLSEFRGLFTDDEIKDIMAGKPGFEETVSKLIALNRRDEGGRVYRRAQSLLKPKAKKKLSRLESDARVTEAVNQILQELKAQGIEPKPSPNKPIKPLQRLLLLVNPENAAKIDKAIALAIGDAEHNAGIKAAIKNAQSADERQELLDRFSAGEEPDDDMVEEGLNLPEFAHWKALRDNLLGYSPTTLKVVQNLIRADFAGVRYGKKPTKNVASTKIDLGVLAKQPDDEVRRVIKAYVDNLDANMTLAGATDDTRMRITEVVQQEVTQQLERIRKQMRDVLFANPPQKGVALTPEQRMAQLINAGIFKDERLDVPAMVDRLAGRSALQKLTPNVSTLVGDVFKTPFYRQDELAERFAQELVDRLAVTPEQAAEAKKVFLEAFNQKMKVARESAFKKAMASLDPEAKKVMKQGKGLWKKIEEAVNAGIFDTGVVLQTVAASHGWNIPTAADIARMKTLTAEMSRMGELSQAEKTTIGDSPVAMDAALRDKRAATLEKRIAIKKKIEAMWSKMTHPLTFSSTEGRRNVAMAINEFTSANLLFKIGFAPRLAIDIFTQGALHTPTRAVAAAITRYQNDLAAGRPAAFWAEVNSALRDAYRVRLAATKANLVSARQAMLGKGDVRNVDRLVSRIAIFERMEAEAESLTLQGQTAKASVLRLLHLISFSYRVAQTLDNFQGLPAEYQEMRQQVETALRENGMTIAEAKMNADSVIGDMKAEWNLAIARVQEIFTTNGIDASPNDLKAAAWQVVKSRQYARMKAMGLPADDFEEINRIIRSTVAWAEREDSGLGGWIGATMRKSTEVLANLGLPMPLARFSNAIATGINRKLMFTPLGFFPGAFKDSPWMRTEEDRLQRKVEASIGTMFGLIAAALVFAGVVKVWLKPPLDKEERDLWEKEGHRANTVEFLLPDGSFIPMSLMIGPAALLSPYFTAAGAVKNLEDGHQKAQERLNAEAAKKGLAPGTVKPISAADYLAVAGEVAWNSLIGNRTASGLVSSFTDQGAPNANKFISSVLSPIVPGLPGLQEISRMAGVNLDPKMATVLDFMVPLPTSAAARKNLMGDGVGTDDALQRVVQILTGGSYPLPINPGDAHEAAGYQALYDSGYRPPSVNPGKGYAIDGEYRPLTGAELQKYTALRSEYLKEALSSLPDPSDRKAVQAAYKDANTRALAAVGVDTSTVNTSSTSSQAGAGPARSTASASTPGAVSSRLPSRRPGIGRGSARGRVRHSASASAVRRRGPSLRPGRGIRVTATRRASVRGGSIRRRRA